MRSLSPENDKTSGFPDFQSLIVWGVSGLMLIALFGLIMIYGSNVPLWDGWDMIPVFTDNQPVTLEWLWSQHNEHRVPLPRLTSILLYKITGVNLKIGMIFNALLMAVLAFALIRAAGRLRGYTSWTDAFFPLLILNLGHATNYLWAWQIQYFLSALLSGIVLLILVQTPSRIPFRIAAPLVGLCLMGMIMCGANGLAAVPPLLGWMGYVVVRPSVNGEIIAPKHKALIAMMGLLVLTLAGLYFLGYERVPYHPDNHNLKYTLYTGLQVLTVGLGPGLYLAWPVSGFAAFVFMSLSVLLLAGQSLKPEEQDRAVGLFSFLAAISMLCLAIGYGRNALGFDPDEIETQFLNEIRYLILIVPVWCGVYLVFSLYAPARYNLLIRGVLCVLALLLIWPNTNLGLMYAKNIRSNLQYFEQDVEAGVAPYELIPRHWEYLHVNQDILNDYFPMLREAGVGSFKFMADNPVFEELQAPLEITYADEVEVRNDTLFGKGPFSYISFRLPEPTFINGLYFKYRHSNPEGMANFRMLLWNDEDVIAGQTENLWVAHYPRKFYQPTGDYQNWPNGTWLKVNDPEPSNTHWINDTVKEIRIYPDLIPCKFYLSDFKLLVNPENK